ncbi:MAG: ATP-dependent dethiobiotin synthetase BioD [Lentisphaeria bacterium]|nr:ATP-dependent dethiobiotin synthetase BioD [Lentisphaeria bacterium]
MAHFIYFVSGIDTGVGKTIATGVMARWLLQRKISVATVKLVQTGCHGFSEDLDMHRKIMGIPPLPEDKAGLTAPQIFDFPASPHLAASLERRTVDVEHIGECVRRVSAQYEVTLVEGAGGLAVPLTESLLTVDFAASELWPVILVCSGKLGALNHAILSVEALRHRDMDLAGVVYNYCADADPVIDRDTPRMIEHAMRRSGYPPALVRLGKWDPASNDARLPDFSPVFQEALHGLRN